MNFKYFIIFFFLLSCSKKKHIIMPNIKGKIYSKADDKPIKGVGIFVSKFAINRMNDTIKTDDNGAFLYNGFFVDNYSDLRSASTMIQQVFYLNNHEIYKYIDVKRYYNKNDYNKKDTIDLGIIYFENLKCIERGSVPE